MEYIVYALIGCSVVAAIMLVVMLVLPRTKSGGGYNPVVKCKSPKIVDPADNSRCIDPPRPAELVDCVCPNGTPYENKPRQSCNATPCQSCDDTYTLRDGQCVKKNKTPNQPNPPHPNSWMSEIPNLNIFSIPSLVFKALSYKDIPDGTSGMELILFNTIASVAQKLKDDNITLDEYECTNKDAPTIVSVIECVTTNLLKEDFDSYGTKIQKLIAKITHTNSGGGISNYVELIKEALGTELIRKPFMTILGYINDLYDNRSKKLTYAAIIGISNIGNPGDVVDSIINITEAALTKAKVNTSTFKMVSHVLSDGLHFLINMLLNTKKKASMSSTSIDYISMFDKQLW